MKTAILGFSGCGKSTFARQLGEKYQVPVLHLDSVHWLPGWVENQKEAEQLQVKEFMDSHESWIIEGNYGKLLRERRLEEAERIILFELNRFVCLWRVLKRWKMYFGVTRPDMGEGCPEKVDWEFIRWVLHDGRDTKKKADFDRIAEKYPEKPFVSVR